MTQAQDEPATAPAKAEADEVNAPPVGVLFTCIGRRVALLQRFRAAAERLHLAVTFCGTDTSKLSPALQLCDEAFLVKPTTHAEYADQLLSLVKRHGIRLLVPTVDLDLRLLARHETRFADLGCRVLISAPEIIDICQDKRRTSGFLSKHGFDCPLTMSVRQTLSADRKGLISWPRFVKRWDGYASQDNAVAQDREELQFFAKRIPNAICQEYIEGTEFTCDVYVDFEMQVRCVVPRRRIEVRSGEVSKGQIVKHREIMAQARRLVELLEAGPGVITLQVFLTKEQEVKFVEINPRFGGGVPLSIEAGADFPRWILQELIGKRPRIEFDAFQDGLVMLRYDAEVWRQESDIKGTEV
jgi:carbamoyl-phosphate synthase large subunit